MQEEPVATTVKRDSTMPDHTTTPPDSLLTIDDVTKYFGDLCAVDVPELALNDGEFFTLLGPSGSGKSTLLRMIAGLETPTAGTITLDGADITPLSPDERPTALIFQSFQLFPHKTVGENIEFPLKMRGVSKEERRAECKELLEFIDLEGYYDRYPEQLSGGEQQRVSLARGLIYEPDVLLLDEPLASLDRNLREKLQVELRKYQRRLDITFVYVTHDQEVALTMSDRIAVMNEGNIVQVGEPMDVYNKPASEFVATFLGEVNSITGRVEQAEDDSAVLSANDVSLPARRGDGVKAGAGGVFCIKSENFRFVDDAATESHVIEGTVRDKIFTGKLINYLITPETVDVEGEDLVVSVTRQEMRDIDVGDHAAVTWTPTDAHIYGEAE